MNKTIYVDFDGTIVDVFPRFYGILDCYIKQYHHGKLEYNSYKKLKRMGKKDHVIVKEIFVELEIDVEKYVEFKRKRLESMQWLLQDKIIGNPKDAYCKLKRLGYDVVLLTQRCNPGNLQNQIDKLQIVDCFDDIVVVKPIADVNSKAQYIEKYFSDKDIIVGDSKVEIEAANLLNIKGYFVNTGLFNSFSVGKYDMLFKDYNAVADYLLKKNS